MLCALLREIEDQGLLKYSSDQLKTTYKFWGNKSKLASHDGEYRNAYLRSSKTHTERLIDLNFRTLLCDLPNRRNYRVSGNGRVVSKENGDIHTSGTILSYPLNMHPKPWIHRQQVAMALLDWEFLARQNSLSCHKQDTTQIMLRILPSGVTTMASYRSALWMSMVVLSITLFYEKV